MSLVVPRVPDARRRAANNQDSCSGAYVTTTITIATAAIAAAARKKPEKKLQRVRSLTTRKAVITIAIRLRFDYDPTATYRAPASIRRDSTRAKK